jgi:hypothetical protein
MSYDIAIEEAQRVQWAGCGIVTRLIHMIRKGQACWSAVGAKVGLLHRFIVSLFAATK